ncbi:hypothetical protein METBISCDRAFT_22219 [Metschnikowia bicuspidata]|uniref:Transmembrane 9 superfamily member n=1 Tax=Metschnikowia bicuspidata TaxID=27322 RepID=A0A4P9ZF05_9ASCO|nr:hypothetical protein METBISCDRAFT_22219 [Metschnikowia bicuspidata]
MGATATGIERAQLLVRNGYLVHWNVDGLPVTTTFTGKIGTAKFYAAGFTLGYLVDDVAYLDNHVTLVLRYHKEKNCRHSIRKRRIHKESGSGTDKDPQNVINYTCAVYWREERLMDYNNRWNLHYAIDNLSRSSSVHWLSLLNSLMLVGVLSLVAATFVYQLVRADHRISAKEEAPETDHRWRLLAADAIQQPRTVGVLSMLAAYGVWSLVATLDVLLTLFLNNELHFGLAISASAFFNNHQGLIFMCSAALSTTLLAGMVVINCVMWVKESSNAVPFGTFVVIVVFFAVVEIPICLLGGMMDNGVGFSLRSSLMMSYTPLLSSFLPQPGIHRQLAFAENSLAFSEKGTVLSGSSFLFTTTRFIVLCLYFGIIPFVSEAAVMLTYVLLTVFYDAHWQWMSFAMPTFLSVYILLYSVYYHVYHLQIVDFVSSLIYFAYMALVSVTLGIACGAVGVSSSLLYLRKIYSAAKRD